MKQKQEAKRKERKDFAWLRTLESFAAPLPPPAATHRPQREAGCPRGVGESSRDVRVHHWYGHPFIGLKIWGRGSEIKHAYPNAALCVSCKAPTNGKWKGSSSLLCHPFKVFISKLTHN